MSKTKYYDWVVVTNIPAFYKINQWNEISKKTNLLVIYTGDTIQERNKDFFKGERLFDEYWLSGGKISQLKLFYKKIKSISYSKLLLCSWDHLVPLSAAFLLFTKNKYCIVESSIYESSVHGFKGFVKKMFFKNMKQVFASGISQEQLVRSLDFKGPITLTGGCGILNYLPQPAFCPRNNVTKFLFVGRLAKVKNLALLIKVFNSLPNLELGIIGFGPMESELKSIANNNIKFLGPIPNKDLHNYYETYDVFVLPSKSEVWGLVVEEALNNGLPVIVSDRVGCKDDLVTKDTGLVFQWNDENDLIAKVKKICNVEFYNTLRLGVSKLDFTQRAARQVNVFLDVD